MKRPSSWRSFALPPPTTPNFGGTLTYGTDNTFLFSASGVFKGAAVGDFTEGDRITAFKLQYLGDGTVISPAFGLYAVTGANALTGLLGTITIVSPPASWASYVLTLATPHVMQPGEALILNTDAVSKAGHKLGPVGIQSDRL